MKRSVVALASAVVLAGCSYTAGWFNTTPASSTLQLESEPQGAQATTSLGGACKTPCALPVIGAADFTVTFTLAGYAPQTVPVTFVPPPDSRSDPNPRLDPNPVHAALAPAGPPPKPPVKRKPRPVAKKPATPPAADAQPAPAGGPGGGPVAASPFPPPPH
jgi:hypothetical protein